MENTGGGDILSIPPPPLKPSGYRGGPISKYVKVCKEQKYGNGYRRSLKPRATVLARTSGNFPDRTDAAKALIESERYLGYAGSDGTTGAKIATIHANSTYRDRILCDVVTSYSCCSSIRFRQRPSLHCPTDQQRAV
jgi:hypothetical protein